MRYVNLNRQWQEAINDGRALSLVVSKDGNWFLSFEKEVK